MFRVGTISTGSISAGHDVIIGHSGNEIIELVKFFTLKTDASNEARIKAEAQADRLAEQLGIHTAALIGLLNILGEQDVTPAEIPIKLKEIARKCKEVLEIWPSVNIIDDDGLHLLLSAALNEGDFEKADSLLKQAQIDDLSRAHKAEEALLQARSASQTYAIRVAHHDVKRGDVGMIRLRYADAAAAYGSAAKRLAELNSDNHNDVALMQIHALMMDGSRNGNNESLIKGIRLTEAILNTINQQQDRKRFAHISYVCGLMWSILGEHTNNLHDPIRAIFYYESALKFYTIDSSPNAWAEVTYSISVIEGILGEREPEHTTLKSAVRRATEAQKVYTSQDFPLEWALCQQSIGNALNSLGERSNGTLYLTQALGVFESTATENLRKSYPVLWAGFQQNIGNVYSRLGVIKDSKILLNYSIRAYEKALSVIDPIIYPIIWSSTQSSLATTIIAMGVRTRRGDLLERAIHILKGSLSVLKRDRVPISWAATNSKIGNAYLISSSFHSESESLNNAISSFHESLLEFTYKNIPHDWTQAVVRLGQAYDKLGTLTEDHHLLEKAKYYFEQCLDNADPDLMYYNKSQVVLCIEKLNKQLNRNK